MNNLIAMLPVMVERKPKFGDSCNRCGYCCATEVCAVGKETGGGEYAPCNHLEHDNETDLFGCALIRELGADNEISKQIGAGTGCDAMTQNEIIALTTI